MRITVYLIKKYAYYDSFAPGKLKLINCNETEVKRWKVPIVIREDPQVPLPLF
jgi:hypothetical protein